MKNILSILLLGLAIPVMMSACKDDAVSNAETYKDARVVFRGDPAVDGCGWLIQTEKEILHPVNLSKGFQVDSLKVSIKYKPLSSTWNCGWRLGGYKQIQLITIER